LSFPGEGDLFTSGADARAANWQRDHRGRTDSRQHSHSHAVLRQAYSQCHAPFVGNLLKYIVTCRLFPRKSTLTQPMARA
jgi:hypothetical protein